MSDQFLFKPRAGESVKNGTVSVQAPKAIGAGWYQSSNYRIDTYVSNLPTTGEVVEKYQYDFSYDKVRSVGLHVENGSGAVVDAVADKKIRVVGYVFLASLGTTVTFQSNATPIFSGLSIDASGGVSAYGGNADINLFETSVGESLVVNTATGVVNGHVSYVVV